MEDNLFFALCPVMSVANKDDKKEFKTTIICLMSVPEKG